jgi:hypothetical protein
LTNLERKTRLAAIIRIWSLYTDSCTSKPYFRAEKLGEDGSGNLDEDVAEEEDGIDPVEELSSWVSMQSILRKTLKTSVAWGLKRQGLVWY